MIRQMIRQNKKMGRRASENLLADFWWILTFAIIMLLFFVLFVLTKDKVVTSEINERFKGSDAAYMLNAYLKSPSIIDHHMSNAQVMAQDYLSDDYENTTESIKLYFTGMQIINGALEKDSITKYRVDRVVLCIHDKDDNLKQRFSLDETTNVVNTISIACDMSGNIGFSTTAIPTRNSYINVEIGIFGTQLP